MLEKMKKAKEAVISQAPLIHCITNPISINDCANVVLALGAKPIWQNTRRKSMRSRHLHRHWQSTSVTLPMQGQNPYLYPVEWLKMRRYPV